ncbi:Lrp/AsnC family transcriptional regulator, leucine-responsive regulatory protein [Zhouia amylolytica]|uniref:Leucine-responsive regulatory protein n=2 Tax=Zhouia amylolytica TaxID=376730 RepID=W2UNC4_9FLAO|nr:Lrp/AsnC family transcriptional regulator [Zhouia amylolytica]ETN94817.1 leucine-responsive regulatory protein [Zhouia amylolytica AD3]MCQ0110997.1 Lrp/AsnC family transcriptional regulator [Zhouia amylolytica]SFS72533.1 Lrp/AsnC family transcriptional regulator, leucine-responsive regulatory protein [Zhouia amylolytica]
MISLDAIDIQLLEALQKDAKQSVKQLAEQVNLSVTPVHERIKKMENSGLIKEYVAVIDPDLLGKNLVAYCQVTLVRHKEEQFQEFEAYMNTLDEVMEVSYVAGNYDFLIKVLLRDMDEFQYFILHKLSKLEVISNIQSSFVIKSFKNNSAIKIRK